MTELVVKPVVCITDALISRDDTQYFAIPEDYKALLVALGNTEKCWIEVFPVDSSDSEGIDDFNEEFEVAVDIDNSFFPPGMRYSAIVNCRWFALLADK